MIEQCWKIENVLLEEQRRERKRRGRVFTVLRR